MENTTFVQFIFSNISISVIAGLFSYRLLNSFLDNILLPLVDISILPECKFYRLSKMYNLNKKPVKKDVCDENYVYIFKPGIFLKEFIIWSITMIFLFFLYKAF